jgi:hypothetical protein
MKRCISALAASLLLALAGGVANAYADSSLGAPALGQENAVQSAPSTSATQLSQPPPVGQSQAPAQANSAANEQASAVVEAANIQTGLNNNTVQASEEKTQEAPTSSRVPPVDGNGGNEHNGNTNTAGDQTAVNGNNFQQSNEQTQSTTQPRSGGACCPSRSNETPGAGQQNKARNEQASFVLGAANVQTGLNNNTVQVGGGKGPAPASRIIPGGGGGGNESNGNTNTAGDQTAVNGNNFQQTNESNGSGASQSNGSDGGWKKDDCRSKCSPCDSKCGESGNHQGAIVLGGLNVQTGLNNNTVQIGSGNESNHNTNTVGDQTAVNGANYQQSNESNGGSGGVWKRPGGNSPGGGQRNTASNHQGAIVIGGLNVQTGLNNNTVQIGSDNESNHNTNTVGDQTAVNGTNYQQSNEQTGSRKGDWKGDDWKGDDCHSSCEPKPQPCEPEPKCEPKPKCPDEKSPEHGTYPAGQSNHASNHQGAIVIGGLNVQTGLNNNTVQIGSDNESNGNTNTVGDQTAVNGDNFQQSNTSSNSTHGENDDWKGGDWKGDDCHSSCEPKQQPCEPKPKCEPRPKCEPEPKCEPKPQRCEPEPKCEPKPKCPDEKRSEHSSHPAGQQNQASNRQASFVLGALNLQTGLNNNTVQIGSGNESNHNTNTVGDQTAVNGNNFQQANKRVLG